MQVREPGAELGPSTRISGAGAASTTVTSTPSSPRRGRHLEPDEPAADHDEPAPGPSSARSAARPRRSAACGRWRRLQSREASAAGSRSRSRRARNGALPGVERHLLARRVDRARALARAGGRCRCRVPARPPGSRASPGRARPRARPSTGAADRRAGRSSQITRIGPS